MFHKFSYFCNIFIFCREAFEKVQFTASYLLNQVAQRPSIGIVCGTGLGGFTDVVENAISFSYADIPHFKASTGMI